MDTTIVRTVAESCLDRVRRHPFIVKAHEGRLTRAEAERWVMCAGRESRVFPEILEGMVGRCSDSSVRSILQSNLDDEHGNGVPEEAHFRHYLRLLDDLGIPRGQFETYRERAGIRLALSLARCISVQDDESLAIGYMLVNEGMTPITYEAARSALTQYHPSLPTHFFDLHIEVDEHHVEDLYKAVDQLPESRATSVLFGVSIGERGMAVLLDEALGIFDHDSDGVCRAACGRCTRAASLRNS